MQKRCRLLIWTREYETQSRIYTVKLLIFQEFIDR